MQNKKVHRSKIPQFSGLQEILAYQQEDLSEFIGLPYSLANFQKQIDLKSIHYTAKFRQVLQAALSNQYAESGIVLPNGVAQLANSTTYTVTTGHQLNLFTGPLYFLYKIIHTIKLAEELKRSYPNYDFIPVYWMASEDHDFAEINHFFAAGMRFDWHTPQSGPVGRFDLDDWEVWRTVLLNHFDRDREVIEQLLANYSGANLKDATRKLVHHLFGSKGLVCVDGDDVELKKLFRKTMVKEVLEEFSAPLVEATSVALKEKGVKPQVHARPINLFFIEKGHRERLIPINGNVQINGKGEFTPIEMVDLLENRPDLFSPNVVLRPLYQETILPNLCYIGGAGELAYWLQLKAVFDKAEVVYPMLSLRNSLQLIDKGTVQKIEQLGFQVDDFFQPVDALKKEFVARHAAKELDFEDVVSLLNKLEAQLQQKAEQVDKTLVAAAGGEMARIKKTLDVFKGRLLKAEKQRFEQELNRIEKLHNIVLPGGVLQERRENFIAYFLRMKPDFLALLHEKVQPFESDFMIIEY